MRSHISHFFHLLWYFWVLIHPISFQFIIYLVNLWMIIYHCHFVLNSVKIAKTSFIYKFQVTVCFWDAVCVPHSYWFMVVTWHTSSAPLAVMCIRGWIPDLLYPMVRAQKFCIRYFSSQNQLKVRIQQLFQP